MHPTVTRVTRRIRERSAPTREAYLERVQKAIARPRSTDRMGCANVAHAFAALPADPERTDDLRYVRRYNEIIARFGRFPHRNQILGRQSTPAEIAFLAELNSRS